MTEKNIFAYKLFLSLNISDFNLFLCENCNPCLIKVTPSFPATPSKSWGPVKPPFLKIWLKAQPSPAERVGCTLWACCPNLMFLDSPWLKIHRFSNWLLILLTLSSSKLIFILITLDKPELTLLVPFYWLWTGQLNKI